MHNIDVYGKSTVHAIYPVTRNAYLLSINIGCKNCVLGNATEVCWACFMQFLNISLLERLARVLAAYIWH